MKIGFFETQEWEEVYLRTQLAGDELVFFPKNPDAQTEAQKKDIEILCNFINYHLTPEALSEFPKLKYVTTRSTGFDHIDLKACAGRGVPVSNVPTYGENTVAEYTFTLLLALSRKLYPSLKRIREQGLFVTENLQGFDLQGKTLGVIGTGHIGTYVVKIATGFGMKVIAFDPFPRAELATQFGFTYVSLEDLLKTSDVVTLHVPYMPSTHHLLNSQNLPFIKPGCVIINTARGGLVETSALVEALKSGRVAAAGLDVLEEEGFIKEELQLLTGGHPNEDQLKTALVDHELMQMDNVLVTPHNAFNTKEALTRILDTTVSNIKNFKEGKPANIVK